MILLALVLTVTQAFRPVTSSKPAPVHHKFGDGTVDLLKLPEHY